MDNRHEVKFVTTMKKLTSTMIVLALFAWPGLTQSLSKTDRSRLVEHFRQTQAELVRSTKGLSEAQIHFRPAKDAWSIAECMEHIAISEKNIFSLVEMALQTEPDPLRRHEVQMSDEQVLGLIISRERKVKTRPEFEPNNNFGDYQGSLIAFKEQRKENLIFVKKTDEDLRNRYCTLPFGTIDAYQTLLFLSGHLHRHTDQIKEIKASANFPG